VAISLSKAAWNEQVRASLATHPFIHQGGCFRMELMDRADRLKRLRFRAWHRGTKEADLMIGGFFDTCSSEWSDAEIEWFERLLEEQDVDIMAWAIGTQPPPAPYQCEMMSRFQTIDYIKHPR
jgi:antitoxin CptB